MRSLYECEGNRNHVLKSLNKTKTLYDSPLRFRCINQMIDKVSKRVLKNLVPFLPPIRATGNPPHPPQQINTTADQKKAPSQ